MENFNTREQEEFGQCHIINCDIVDNHEDATLGAIILSQLIEELVQHEGIVSHKVPPRYFTHIDKNFRARPGVISEQK